MYKMNIINMWLAKWNFKIIYIALIWYGANAQTPTYGPDQETSDVTASVTKAITKDDDLNQRGFDPRKKLPQPDPTDPPPLQWNPIPNKDYGNGTKVTETLPPLRSRDTDNSSKPTDSSAKFMGLVCAGASLGGLLLAAGITKLACVVAKKRKASAKPRTPMEEYKERFGSK